MAIFNFTVFPFIPLILQSSLLSYHVYFLTIAKYAYLLPKASQTLNQLKHLVSSLKVQGLVI